MGRALAAARVRLLVGAAPRRRGAGEVVGFCGVKVMELYGEPVLNLFYRLDRRMWGQGLAGEAAAAVVRWAGRHGGGRRLVARVRPGNVAYRRVAARAGPGFDGFDWIYVSAW